MDHHARLQRVGDSIPRRRHLWVLQQRVPQQVTQGVVFVREGYGGHARRFVDALQLDGDLVLARRVDDVAFQLAL